MKIDFHTHIFPDNLAEKAIEKLQQAERVPVYTKGTAASLLASCKNADILISVVLPVATKVSQTSTINDNAIRMNEEFNIWLANNPGILKRADVDTPLDVEPVLYSFGGLHPDNEDYREQIDTLVKNGIRGIKVHPVFQRTYFDDIRYMRILDYAFSKDLYVNVHAGSDLSMPKAEFAFEEHIIPVLREFKSNKLILAHMGGWNRFDHVEEMLSEYKPTVDTSLCIFKEDGRYAAAKPMTTDAFNRLVEKVGVENVLFGTDSPWADQAESIRIIENACENREWYECIAIKNALRILA